LLNKKPWIVPIPGSRKLSRMEENLHAVDIVLSEDEVKTIDKALDAVGMSAVFGGSRVESRQ